MPSCCLRLTEAAGGPALIPLVWASSTSSRPRSPHRAGPVGPRGTQAGAGRILDRLRGRVCGLRALRIVHGVDAVAAGVRRPLRARGRAPRRRWSPTSRRPHCAAGVRDLPRDPRVRVARRRACVFGVVWTVVGRPASPSAWAPRSHCSRVVVDRCRADGRSDTRSEWTARPSGRMPPRAAAPEPRSAGHRPVDPVMSVNG